MILTTFALGRMRSDGNELITSHLFHSRFISEGVAETSQTLQRHYLSKLSFTKMTACTNTADVIAGKPIIVITIYLMCECY
jgi:hypothetical protein